MSNVLTTELDITLVKQYILLPILLDTLERDINNLNMVTLKMTNVYKKMLQQVQKSVHEDLVRVRKQMRAQNIKVYDEQRNKISIQSQYVCRNYHHSFSMLWSLVRAELEMLLSEYLGFDLEGEVNG